MAILENLDNLKEKATEVAMSAARKTKQLAEISKANIEIYALEDKIKKAELELGKLFYRDYAVEEERDEAEYLPWCQKIDEAKRTIAQLLDKIDELKKNEPAEEDEVETDAEADDSVAALPEETASVEE